MPVAFTLKEETVKRAIAFSAVILLFIVLGTATFAAEPADDKKHPHGEKECKSTCDKTCHAYTFRFGGYFKTDIAYDESRTYPGNYALWAVDCEDDALHLTVKQTRLNFNFFWEPNDVTTMAKLEFDFYGVGAAENKAGLMLRHAFLKVSKGRFSLLAGQTSDVISPLVPKTVNYTVAWYQGNIGYRRPQLRFATWGKLGEKAKIDLALAAARTIGGDLDTNTVDDGTDSGLPTFQGRLGIGARFGEEVSLGLGVSGHYGREVYGDDDGEEAITQSFNVDAHLRFNRYIALSGEFFTGKNLKTYFGGIAQAVNELGGEIDDAGGWGQLSLMPRKGLSFNFGYSIDDPDDEDLVIGQTDGVSNEGTFKGKNTWVFGNVMYGFVKNVTAMLEISHFTTNYITRRWDGAVLTTTDKDYDSIRVQFALMAAIK